jgi:HK97 family phage prohead protease
MRTGHTRAELERTFSSSRLVTLADGSPGLRGKMSVEVSAADNSAPIIDFVASDNTLDRYDEVIEPDGWQLENYRRNPVFQNSHQYGDVIHTIGKSLITEVRTVNGRRALFQRIEFATEVNPTARIAYGLYKGKFLNAVSVGFVPLEWENGAPSSADRRTYTKHELLELSAVGIPANPKALALAVKSGFVDRRDLWELLDMAASILSASGHGTARKVVMPSLNSKPAAFKDFGPQLFEVAIKARSILRGD